MNNATSCIFAFEKRVYTADGRPVMLEDGKTVKSNWNFLNFLQVISAYWELRDDGKNQLHIFINGGSVSIDRETGEKLSKAGYTMVVPEFIGTRFMEEFDRWGRAFGLSASAPVPAARNNQHGRNQNRTTTRFAREEEYVEVPAQPDAAWEEQQG